MIGGVFKLFRRGFLSTSTGKLSCTSLGSARLSPGNEPCREVRDWAIQWSFSWTSSEMKASTEVADRNLGFFVCKFCWLMRFWLIYEVLGVWVDRLLFDFVWMISEFLELIQWSFSWTLPKMKASAEVADRNLGFVCFVVWCVFGWSMKFWVFDLMGYCWILFKWFLGFLNLFNGLFLEPHWKWRFRQKLQIEES